MFDEIIKLFNEKNKLNLNAKWSEEDMVNYLLLNLKVGTYNKINFIICLKKRYQLLGMAPQNEMEETFYNGLNSVERAYIIMESYSEIISYLVNDFIKKDIDVLDTGKNKVWITIDLSYLYSLELKCIKTRGGEVNKILPRTKEEEMKVKVLNNIIMISTLKRDPQIIFYLRQKNGNDVPKNISERFGFTKGYKICLDPQIKEDLKGLRYAKKMYRRVPLRVVFSGENNVGDFLNNRKYNKPIWIKSYENLYSEPKDSGLEVFLNSYYNPERVINIINNLNSIGLSIDTKLLDIFWDLANVKGNDTWKLKSRNQLKKDIYSIGEGVSDIIISENDNTEIMNLDRAVQDAATYELITQQVSDIIRYNKNVFYISHKLDTRSRIYGDVWPINYQLNHIVRAVVLIKKSVDYKDIVNKFLKMYSHWGFTEEEFFPFFTKLNKENSEIVERLIGADKYMKECLTQLVVSVAPSLENDENKRFNKALEMIKMVGSKDIIEVSKILIQEGYDDKDTFKLLNVSKIVFLIESGNYKKALDSTVWLDASSNSLQLVAYRMGVGDERLLKLLNIYDNNTVYSGIYEYVSTHMNEESTDERVRKIKEKLGGIDLDLFNSKKEAKRRLMPSVYGNKFYSCELDDRKIFASGNHKDAWAKIPRDKQYEVSKYYWFRSLDIVKGLGFDIDEYKKNFKGKIKRYWRNDLNIPVVINNHVSTRRSSLMLDRDRIEWVLAQNLFILGETKDKYEISKKIIEDTLIGKRKNRKGPNTSEVIKNLIDGEKNEYLKRLIKLKEKIIELNEKIFEDEKIFHRRREIQILNFKLTIRIPSSTRIYDHKAIKRSLLPSSVHTYDVSVLFRVVEMGMELGIELLTIHDSVGCQLGLAPIVRLLFIMVNIELIEKSQKKAPYPYKKVKETKIDTRRMLKSRNIFRM